MDRSEDEVARFGGVQCGFERLGITHFTDQHDVRVFTDKGTKTGLEVQHVDADFTLVNRGLLVFEDVLDRIFERHDVDALAIVDVVEHRGDRRRLTGARHTGEDDDALRLHGDLGHHFRKVQILEGQDVARDQTRGDGDLAASLEEVHTEAVAAVVVVGEVDRAELVQILELDVREDVLGDRHELFVGDGIGVESLERAAEADLRDGVRLHDEVGALELDARLEELAEASRMGIVLLVGVERAVVCNRLVADGVTQAAHRVSCFLEDGDRDPPPGAGPHRKGPSEVAILYVCQARLAPFGPGFGHRIVRTARKTLLHPELPAGSPSDRPLSLALPPSRADSRGGDSTHACRSRLGQQLDHRRPLRAGSGCAGATHRRDRTKGRGRRTESWRRHRRTQR